MFFSGYLGITAKCKLKKCSTEVWKSKTNALLINSFIFVNISCVDARNTAATKLLSVPNKNSFIFGEVQVKKNRLNVF